MSSLYSDSFRRNFRNIAGANVGAQVIGLFAFPILTRLFSPESFGVLTSFTVIQALGLSLMMMRLDWLIPNASQKSEVRQLYEGGIAIAVLGTMLALMLVGVSSSSFREHLGLSSASIVVWLMPFGILMGSYQLLTQSVYIFDGDLSRIAVSKVLRR